MTRARIAVAVLLASGLAWTSPLVAEEPPLAVGSEGVPVPRKVKDFEPKYPPEAAARGIRGIVILDLIIDATGRVESVSVVRSVSGLDDAAVAAANQWRYEPVKVAGRPVRVRMTVPITFSLALPTPRTGRRCARAASGRDAGLSAGHPGRGQGRRGGHARVRRPHRRQGRLGREQRALDRRPPRRPRDLALQSCGGRHPASRFGSRRSSSREQAPRRTPCPSKRRA